MGTRPPGKMAQELEKLRAENAALRDLLAAVQETAAAGENAHGVGDRWWQPGWRAAMRIASWLDDVSGQNAIALASTAGMFRKNVSQVTEDAAPSIASDEAAAVLAASIASGQPVIVTDDSPFADRHHDPDAAWAAGDDNPLRIVGGVQ